VSVSVSVAVSVAVFGLSGSVFAASPTCCAADAAHCLVLRLHAFDSGDAREDARWVQTQLVAARRHFAPIGVDFALRRGFLRADGRRCQDPADPPPRG
jgi:hypothetical protein